MPIAYWGDPAKQASEGLDVRTYTLMSVTGYVSYVYHPI
jgi:hypothetical protein